MVKVFEKHFTTEKLWGGPPVFAPGNSGKMQMDLT